jgi:hypothetical protein
MFLKSIACAALLCKIADEIKIFFFSKSLTEKNTNKLAVTSSKLANNFMGLVASGLGPDMACGPPV